LYKETEAILHSPQLL